MADATPSRAPRTPAPARRPHRRVIAAAVLATSLLWPTAAHAAVPTDQGTEVAAAPASVGALSGRVTDTTGQPVEGVQVLVGDSVTTQTAADGTWAVEGLGDGPAVVRFVVDDALGQPSSLAWDGTPYGTYGYGSDASQAQDPTSIDLTLVGNTALGTVTAGGAPVAGATVSLHQYWRDDEPVREVTTAADGTWSAGWMRPGSYTVRVTPPAGSGLAQTWWLASGNSRGDVFFTSSPRDYPWVDVALATESQLTGRLVDEAGQPVAGAPVALWTGGFRPVQAATAVTAADGTYVFGGLGAGSYTVQAVRPAPGEPGHDAVVASFLGGALQARLAKSVTVGEQDEVAVEDLVRRLGAAVSGEIVADRLWGGAGLSVEIVGPDGSVVASAFAHGPLDGPDFASDGAVPAGQYRVRASVDDTAYWWVGGNSFDTARVFEVRPGVPVTDVEIVLSADHVQQPTELTDELTDGNRRGLSVAAPVVAGGTASVAGITEGLNFGWLASASGNRPLGFGSHVDGALALSIPADTPAGAYRLAVTTPGGYLLGWADLTVLAASGDVQSAPLPGAAPTATARAEVASASAAGSRATTRSGVLAATGADVAWLVACALGLGAVGAGLVVLRRRRSA